jgi:ABC-type branched-subunit amino acid transport system substrate-binding protein
MHRFALLMFVLALVAIPAMGQDAGLPEWLNHTACEVDLTGETITLWHIGDLSGPYAPITQPLLAGFEDALSWLNGNGGICGAQVIVPDPTTVDTGGDQNQTSVIYDRVSSQNPLLVVLYSSDDSELLRDRLAEDQIPAILSAGSTVGLYGGEEVAYNAPGWIFATNPLYIDQLGAFCEFAGANLDSPVLGYLSWPNAFGRAAYTPETVAYCAEQGVTVLEPEFFAPGSDIQGQVQNLVDNGANILYTNSLGTGPAEIAAAVTNMGLNDQVTLSGVNWVLDTSVGFLGQTTINPTTQLPSVNGMYGSMPFYWWTETDQPGIQIMIEYADAAERSPLVRNIAYILGWQMVDLYVEAVTITANRDGDLTSAGVYETLDNFVYSPLGILDLDYRDGNRDAKNNRIAQLFYLGQDGASPAGPDNPPFVAQGSSGPVLVPIVVGVTDFEEAPDLRPRSE